jgi:hypothetical protein
MQVERQNNVHMQSIESSPDSVPIPALLVERATALARAEAGLALVHTRRIAVAAVSALLGTIVACAFAQLAILLIVAWPVLVARVPLPSLLTGVLLSVVLSAGGAAFAVTTWLAVARQRRNGVASRSSGAPQPLASSEGRSTASSAPPRSVGLAERVSP